MSTPVPGITERSPEGARVLADRYRLGRRIGAGGMATILRATDLQMDREVAVKVLHAHLADDAEVRTRFRAEARHAASLSHPHVVAVYDQGEADLPYIVLELIDGPSLREVLATHGPLSLAETLTVVAPLCDALDAAHRIGLIHRDVKPENVLVTPDGLPKLADFGIARVMAATSHTATGTLVGSVHYLAPELIDGVEATPASDQYALAVLTFELLTGRKPLPADTPMAIALRHANEAIPPPSRYAPEVSPALDAVIARATSHDPADRYPDLATMAMRLRAAIDADPAPVTHLTDDGVLQTLILPSELAETSSLATPDVAAELAARRQVAPPPRRASRRWGRRLGVALLVLAGLGVLAAGGVLAWTQFVVPDIVIADVVGQDQQEAFTILDGDGLVMRIAEEEHRLDIPAGQVISQDPAAGSELPQGQTVAVVVSLGPRVVDMPDVLGRPYEEVADLLTAEAFEVVLGQEHHDTFPRDAVIGQAPPPGEPVEQGATVNLTLSLGIEQVTVPTVVGLSVPEATSALTSVRLDIAVTEAWSDEVPEAGVVISQDVAADSVVDALGSVAVVASRGPLTVEVPDLRGLPVSEARSILAAIAEVGLTEETSPVPTLGPFTLGTPDRVERQIPAPGEPIRRGEWVQVFYFTQ